MKRHAYSALFPDMQPAEFDALVANIAENGYDPNLPIVVYDNQILDGWHRHRACLQLKIEPIRKGFEGGDFEALLFSVRANAQRRNLTVGQLAVIACELIPLYQEKSRERQLSGKRAPLAHQQAKGKSSEQVGKDLGVGKSSVEMMLKLRKEAPELADLVRMGETTVREAYDQHIANKRAAEAERQRKAEAARLAEENRNREEAARKKREAAEAERARKKAEEDAARQKEQARAKREAAEKEKNAAAAAKLREEAEKAERARRAAEEEQRKQKEESERKKRESEEAAARARSAESARVKKAQEEERLKWEKYMASMKESTTSISTHTSNISSLLVRYRESGRLEEIQGFLKTLYEVTTRLCRVVNIPVNAPPIPTIERDIIDV